MYIPINFRFQHVSCQSKLGQWESSNGMVLHIASDSVDIDMFAILRYWQSSFISIILEIDPEELSSCFVEEFRLWSCSNCIAIFCTRLTYCYQIRILITH